MLQGEVPEASIKRAKKQTQLLLHSLPKPIGSHPSDEDSPSGCGCHLVNLTAESVYRALQETKQVESCEWLTL